MDAWARFAAWASSVPGAGDLRLARDAREPEVFVSLGEWESIDAVRAWKGSPELRERLAHVVQHVDGFEPSELTVITSVRAGSVSSS